MNRGEYKSIGTYWIALYTNGDNVTYFKSFGVKCTPEKIKIFKDNKNTTANIIYIIQENGSIMCGHFCIGSIDFRLKGKILLDYTNLFSHKGYKKTIK